MVSKTSEILSEVEQILESRWLKEANQLRNLLRHVVQETLAGRADGLKEYSLGLEVFHRPPGYDPRNDAIVRVQASLLRKRLASYYEHEGRESSLRIELPRGGYHPVFREVEETASPAVSEPAGVEGPQRRSLQPGMFVAGLIGGALITLAILQAPLMFDRATPVPKSTVWEGFVQPRMETIVSFGVPLFYAGGGGFYVRDTSVNKLTDDPGKINRVGEILGRGFLPQEDVYTGIGDAIGTHDVARWLEGKGVPVRVANSNYIGPSDIEGKNLVVVSSARFQTLLQQMNLPDRFPFNPSNPAGFAVPDPLPGEQSLYRPMGGGVGVNTSWAVVSLWPGIPSTRRMMYLSGIETWSTQGAAQYVIDPARLAELQRRLDADPPDGPRGRKSPFLQVLLRVEGKNNRVRTTNYVTHRYLDYGARAAR